MRGVVVGSAGCAPDDWARLVLDGYVDTSTCVIGTNEMFRWLSRFDHLATLHPEKLQGWQTEVDLLGRARAGVRYWVPNLSAQDRIEVMRGLPWPEFASTHAWDWGGGNSGSSGLFAVGIAFSLGCDKVVLAGVPMDTQPHVNKTHAWTDREKFVTAWSAASAKLKGRVRSQSGWTRELLGEPTLHWWGQ